MMILKVGRQRKRHNGFTLLEILLVVLIVAIVVTITTPQFRKSLVTIQLANTTQDIAQLMRFLRVKANNEKCVYQLKFDLVGGKYFAQKVTGGTTNTYEKSRPIPSDIGITMTLNPVNFYSDGSIDKVTIFLFKGKGEFYKDIEKAINKEFDLGQVQSITHTEYIYTINTHPSIGRVEVSVPE